MRKSLLIGWALAAGWIPAARALEPTEIAVLINTRSADSARIARHYSDVRHIPADHLLPVTCDPGEMMTEAFYRQTFVPQVRRELTQRKLDGIKCLVTTYGIPLRVGPVMLTGAEAQEADGYRKQLADTLAAIQREAAGFDAILPATTQPAEPTTRPAPPATLQDAARTLTAAAQGAARRITAAPPDRRGSAVRAWMQVQERVAGIGGVLAAARAASGPADGEPDDPRRAALAEIQKEYAALADQPESPAVRKARVALSARGYGLLGAARQLEEILDVLAPDNTSACLDSELSLVLADQHYPRANWVVNPMNLDAYAAAPQRGAAPQTLLVTRLDGTSPAKALAMIDTCLRVEGTGLEGKMYLDARGLAAGDPYGTMDADLRKTAEWLKAHSTMEVVLDDRPALLEAKDCPDAALYCGWYSLASYQESCQWLPGAVGYHIASLEMTTLHRAGNTEWVANLLDRGFGGTLGATEEPYLAAFPKPSQFFPLLLCGEFTQGEVWEVTAPLLSWRVGYVGDPLYNPFKMRPRVGVAAVRADPVLRNAFTILRDGGAIRTGTEPAPATGR